MLGLRFSHLVHASLAGGSLVLAGCVDRAYDFGDAGGFSRPDPTEGETDTATDTDDPPDPTSEPPPPPPPPDVPGPPQLIAAGMVDNLTLALTFSEALAPPQAVDPTQFRLSGAIAPKAYEYYYSYGTNYTEVGRWNGTGYYCEEYCYEYCYDDYCNEQCWEYCYTPSGPPVRFAAITQPPDRLDTLLLTLDNGIGGGVCAHLRQYPEEWISDLFVHYTPQGAAPITDNVGEPLAPIAEHWALEPEAEYSYKEGTLSYMQPQLPIPCPF